MSSRSRPDECHSDEKNESVSEVKGGRADRTTDMNQGKGCRMRRITRAIATLAVAVAAVSVARAEPQVQQRIDKRFAAGPRSEVPDFQRHVVPLMGKLGCNGRACHGSFQGQGGFRLSLFGYDFKMDYENLTKGDEAKDILPRVDTEFPEESLILEKATLTVPHRGGKRMDKGSWQYNVFLSWIRGGAPYLENGQRRKLQRLDVTPREIVFSRSGEKVQLRAVAHWETGEVEDVTPLCRFQTNDDQIAEISPDGLVTAKEAGDTHVVVFYDNGVVAIPVLRPVSDLVGDRYPAVPARTKVDELVIAKLKKLGIVPSEVCDDAEFLRRVKLDLTGTLPTPEEIRQFLADRSPDKRSRKIDELLRSPAYAAWWTQKLCDYTGLSDDALVNVVPRGVGRDASRDWYEWIYDRIARNVPYDKIVEGMVLAVSRAPGESYTDYCRAMSEIYRPGSQRRFSERPTLPHFWARRNFRQPEERVIGFAYSFLGLRIQCAQCHKHPFDQWSQDDFKQFAGFFTSVIASQNSSAPDARGEYDALLKKAGLDKKLRGNELRRKLASLLQDGKVVPFGEVYVRPVRSNARTNRKNNSKYVSSGPKAKLLGAEVVDLTRYDDPRKPLMEWLRRPDNPFFAKAFVNRVWASYFNVGLVNPPDDLNMANAPSNAALLDYLARGFIDSGFDMRWLHREILNSDTYQRSWVPNETNKHDERNFSRAIPRRLPAEVVYDALVQATGADEVVARMQTEMDGRAIALPNAGPRYARRNNGMAYALQVFGRSTRESNCDCDRTSDPSLLQVVFLQNDAAVYQMIDRKDGWLAQVAREHGWSFSPRRSSTLKRPANYERIVAAQRAKIAQLKKQGRKELAKQLAERLRAMLKRYGDPDAAKPQKGQGRSEADLSALVAQAYLRTVSRYPNDAELRRSVEYVKSAESPVDGLRDLLWALINTKEFIVNH
ncbi:MAG: DUF1549 domain-containing protein [Planctomycetota bacterium]|nr:MAG: DUF1549 domain-containing protein [Planctomycetota bacterium]